MATVTRLDVEIELAWVEKYIAEDKRMGFKASEALLLRQFQLRQILALLDATKQEPTCNQ